MWFDGEAWLRMPWRSYLRELEKFPHKILKCWGDRCTCHRSWPYAAQHVKRPLTQLAIMEALFVIPQRYEDLEQEKPNHVFVQDAAPADAEPGLVVSIAEGWTRVVLWRTMCMRMCVEAHASC